MDGRRAGSTLRLRLTTRLSRTRDPRRLGSLVYRRANAAGFGGGVGVWVWGYVCRLRRLGAGTLREVLSVTALLLTGGPQEAWFDPADHGPTSAERSVSDTVWQDGYRCLPSFGLSIRLWYGQSQLQRRPYRRRSSVPVVLEHLSARPLKGRRSTDWGGVCAGRSMRAQDCGFVVAFHVTKSGRGVVSDISRTLRSSGAIG
jgi:hypothetical protein